MNKKTASDGETFTIETNTTNNTLMRSLTLCGFFIIGGILATPATGQSVLFVNDDASGSKNGSSWSDAFTSLQDALLITDMGTEVWVAAGIYTPDEGSQQSLGDKDAHYSLGAGVSLYGGFAGVETEREQRNWLENETILSGDLAGNDISPLDPTDPTREDNSENVFVIENDVTLAAPIIDGFTISGGHSTFFRFGGGILIRDRSHTVLRNLTLRSNYASFCGGALASTGSFDLSDSQVHDNFAESFGCAGGSGGGVYHLAGPDEFGQLPIPIIANVLFRHNRTPGCGGGLASGEGEIHVVASTFFQNEASMGGAVCLMANMGFPAIYANTIFVGNLSTDWGGGAFYSSHGDAIIFNSVFSGNKLADDARFSNGGAIYLENSSLDLVHSSLTNNVADFSGAAYIALSSLRIANSILWSNSTANGQEINSFQPNPSWIKYSISSTSAIQGFETEALVSADPLFTNPAGDDGIIGTLDDNLRLLSQSIAIDVGSEQLIPQDTIDLDGDGDKIETVPLDLDGLVRISGSGQTEFKVDLGPYEYQQVSTATERSESYERLWPISCSILYLYPNPTRGKITIGIRGKDGENGSMQLIDFLGRILEKTIITRTSDNAAIVELDLSRRSSGTYRVSLKNENDGSGCSRSFTLIH